MHNPSLAKKQGLDETTCDIIDKLHVLRDFLKEVILKEGKKSRPNKVKIMENYDTWVENELLLQELWKFPYDESYFQNSTKSLFSDIKVIVDAYPEYFV